MVVRSLSNRMPGRLAMVRLIDAFGPYGGPLAIVMRAGEERTESLRVLATT